MDEPSAYTLADAVRMMEAALARQLARVHHDAVVVRSAFADSLLSDTLEELAGLQERRDALAKQIAELLEQRLELEMELTNTKHARED